ncbi:DUF6489 family protein [Parvularcula dongshanensis]|uniref:Uncharacterized protein n=1 Tax=Parvularcula dongshanensis TaxID=1173995 RepID=A0A840I175_9PROT|nr:DUF6489 family protein [Parvularcula dongshanensis]MBB4658031.1 hypothetical protein [Parvularcula dongshanensis]
MKITLNVDCTPEEARAFLGLPDLSGVNAVLVSELERRTRENVDTLADPKAFWDKALSAGVGSMDAFATLFARASKTSGQD